MVDWLAALHTADEPELNHQLPYKIVCPPREEKGILNSSYIMKFLLSPNLNPLCYNL